MTAPSDALLVSGVLAGDRDAFAAVYDRYADRLHDFAYSMLRHREDAADAVADAFVTTAERLEQLRDPERLRPWLYAVVRRECLRRLKARSRTAYGGDERPARPARPVRRTRDRRRAGVLRALVWDAAGGLNERDRAMLDLHLRQGLDGAELGEAMGMSADNAYVGLSRLRDQVERSIGALLVARTSRRRLRRADRGARRLGRRVHATRPQAGRPARRPVLGLQPPPCGAGQPGRAAGRRAGVRRSRPAARPGPGGLASGVRPLGASGGRRSRVRGAEGPAAATAGPGWWPGPSSPCCSSWSWWRVRQGRADDEPTTVAEDLGVATSPAPTPVGRRVRRPGPGDDPGGAADAVAVGRAQRRGQRDAHRRGEPGPDASHRPRSRARPRPTTEPDAHTEPDTDPDTGRTWPADGQPAGAGPRHRRHPHRDRDQQGRVPRVLRRRGRPSWLSVTPASGTLKPGQSRSVTVSAERAGLPEGAIQGA